MDRTDTEKKKMWRMFLIAMSMATLGAATLGSGSPRDGAVFPYPIEQKDLANGLRIIGVHFDSPGLVAYYSVVRVGSRHEVEPGRSGFAHFFEHMMFRGTEKYPEDRYNEILRSVGADSNANTSFDRTIYHILASSDSLPRLVEIEADRFQNLKYTEEQFKKEAGAVLGEYNKNASSPGLALREKLNATAFTTHTYRHLPIGFLPDIEAMPSMYDFSLQFFDRFYRPEYTTILVVGDFAWESVTKLVEEHYGQWERGDYAAEIPVEPPQTAPKEESVEWPSPTFPYLMIGYHAPAFSTDDADIPTLDVLSQVAFGETSPLYQDLVIEKQWVDFLSAGAVDQADPTLYIIVTRVRQPEKLAQVREAILGQVVSLHTESIAEDRLSSTKSHMKYRFLMSMNTADAVASTLSHYLALTGDPETVNRVYELYDSVSSEALQKAASKYFKPEARTIVTLRPAPGVPEEE
jgi:zinc protease